MHVSDQQRLAQETTGKISHLFLDPTPIIYTPTCNPCSTGSCNNGITLVAPYKLFKFSHQSSHFEIWAQRHMPMDELLDLASAPVLSHQNPYIHDEYIILLGGGHCDPRYSINIIIRVSHESLYISFMTSSDLVHFS